LRGAGNTIEHIMPQNPNLSPEWRRDLGPNWEEVHKTCLHTLGNLTLTRYNSELSDRPFREKRDMEGGFADSPLRLNKGLAKLETWNEQEIAKRAEALANQALEVWEYPRLSENVLAKDHKKSSEHEGVTYTIDVHPELRGDLLALFEELSKRIRNLDSSVRMEFKKLYIAFKMSTNFVDIVPQKSRLQLFLNMPFDAIQDRDLQRCEQCRALGERRRRVRNLVRQ